MPYIQAPDDFRRASMLPEGVLEHWLVEEGELVADSQAVARLRVDMLHVVAAPCGGRVRLLMEPGDVIEPGTILGRDRRAGDLITKTAELP